MRLALAIGCTAAVLGACVDRPAAPALTAVSPRELTAKGGPVELTTERVFPTGTFEFDAPTRTKWSAAVSARVFSAAGSFALLETSWRNTNSVGAVVPAGLSPGPWSLELTTPRGDVLVLTDALVVLDEAVEPDSGVVVPCTVATFADGDHDGFGLSGTSALLCGPGRADNPLDCNDFDSLTSPDGIEVCNGLDDDCDTLVDEGVCPDAGLSVTRLRTLDDDDEDENDFVAVSVFGPDEAWLVAADRLFVHRADAGFRQRSNDCPNRMNAVWADPTGRAFVAGGNNGVGRIAVANPASSGCSNEQMLPEPVAGLSGFQGSDGGFGVEGLLRDGRRFSWDGVGNPVVSGSSNNDVRLRRGSASTPATFYGVGTLDSQPHVVRVRADGTVFTELRADAGAVLNAVSSPTPLSAVAVGDRGLALRRVNGTWETLATPTTNDLTAVKAFGPGRFVLSSDRGTLLSWAGAWTVTPTDPLPVRAIDGWGEGNLWLVGDKGFIVRVRRE